MTVIRAFFYYLRNKNKRWLAELMILIPVLSVTTYAASTPPPLQVIKNLEKVVMSETNPPPGQQRPEFYANGIELEPFVIHLCGTETIDPKNPTKEIYNKVNPADVDKVQFFAGQSVLLDPTYNPDNRVPLIHESSPPTSDQQAYAADTGEPTYLPSKKANPKILMIYDKNSRYFWVYTHIENFHLGGVAPKPTNQARTRYQRGYASSFYARPNGSMSNTSLSNNGNIQVGVGVGDSGNVCYPNQPSGVGDTPVQLYLLATSGLHNTTDMHLYAYAKADTSGNPQTQGSISYDILPSPVYNSKNMTINQITMDEYLVHEGSYYSFFSTMMDPKKQQIREERGYPVCSLFMGAPFHGLYRYTDHNSKGQICRKTPKTGALDCNVNTCARSITLTTLQSNNIPLHDLYTSMLVVGGACPNISGAMDGGAVFKPIMHSAEPTNVNKDDPMPFYNSYVGGVGAYFYPRFNGQDDTKQLSSGVVGGNPHTFYFFSYVFGATPSPGLECQWQKTAIVTGHDIYGNPIKLNILMANGSDKGKID